MESGHDAVPKNNIEEIKLSEERKRKLENAKRRRKALEAKLNRETRSGSHCRGS